MASMCKSSDAGNLDARDKAYRVCFKWKDKSTTRYWEKEEKTQHSHNYHYSIFLELLFDNLLLLLIFCCA